MPRWPNLQPEYSNIKLGFGMGDEKAQRESKRREKELNGPVPAQVDSRRSHSDPSRPASGQIDPPTQVGSRPSRFRSTHRPRSSHPRVFRLTDPGRFTLRPTDSGRLALFPVDPAPTRPPEVSWTLFSHLFYLISLFRVLFAIVKCVPSIGFSLFSPNC